MWKTAVIAAMVTLAGCRTASTAPGTKNCVTVFFFIGYYQGCAEGPPWPAAQQPEQRPTAVDPRPPVEPPKKPIEWCAPMSKCFPTKQECLDFEIAASRGGFGCEPH